MPKYSGVLFSILFLAFCIGINGYRFPQVWQMLAPGGSAPIEGSLAPRLEKQKTPGLPGPPKSKTPNSSPAIPIRTTSPSSSRYSGVEELGNVPIPIDSKPAPSVHTEFQELLPPSKNRAADHETPYGEEIFSPWGDSKKPIKESFSPLTSPSENQDRQEIFERHPEKASLPSNKPKGLSSKEQTTPPSKTNKEILNNHVSQSGPKTTISSADQRNNTRDLTRQERPLVAPIDPPFLNAKQQNPVYTKEMEFSKSEPNPVYARQIVAVPSPETSATSQSPFSPQIIQSTPTVHLPPKAPSSVENVNIFIQEASRQQDIANAILARPLPNAAVPAVADGWWGNSTAGKQP